MHNPCYDTYRRSNSKCPVCNEDWGRSGGNHRVISVGEAAAPKDDWPRRTRRNATTESEEDEKSGDEEADAQPAPAPAPAATMPDRSQAGSSQAPRRRKQRTAGVG